MDAAWFFVAIFSLLVQASVQDTNSSELQSTFSLSLTPNKRLIIAVTKDIKLRCQHENDGQAQFSELFTLRIEKQNSDESWEDVASLSGGTEAKTTEDQEISVSGNVEEAINGSFIEITWEVAVDNTFGIYRCEAIGLSEELDVIRIHTPVVQIKKKILTPNDILTMLLRDRQKNNDNFSKLNKAITDMQAKDEELETQISSTKSQKTDVSGIEAEMARRFQETEATINGLQDQITMVNSSSETNYQEIKQSLDTLADKFKGLDNEVNTMWPAGMYAILQTDSGCPNDTAFDEGEVGTYGIHTESSDGIGHRTKLSDHIHLPKPLLKRKGNANMLYLRFCAVSENRKSLHDWPAGSYCINRYHPGDCPPRFSPGEFRLHQEETDNKSYKEGEFLIPMLDMIQFCCTDTGSAENSVHLGSGSPFYLYRHGETCQNVEGMSVKEEYIIIDTEDTENYDSISGSAPDGSTNRTEGSFEMQLCYYSQ